MSKRSRRSGKHLQLPRALRRPDDWLLYYDRALGRVVATPAEPALRADPELRARVEQLRKRAEPEP